MNDQFTEAELRWVDERGRRIQVQDNYNVSYYFKREIPPQFDRDWFRKNYLGPDCYGVGLKLVE